ncbi:hypothetical protein DYB37_006498, partial [Aphanomyces astaci]
MKVGVVGLGAIGSLFFNRILHQINPRNMPRSKTDRTNQIYALVKQAHLPHLKKVSILDQQRRLVLEVPTHTSPNADAFCTDYFVQQARSLDALLVTVKSTDTYEVAARLKVHPNPSHQRYAGNAINKDSLVISLQNGTYFSLSTTFVLMICDTGLGNVKILKDVLETDNVLHGVTYMGGVSIGPGSVIQGGAGTTIIQNAEHLSDSVQDTLGHLCTLLAASEIPSISILRWNESVVTGQDNLAIVEAIVNEVAAVANAQGITLNLH